MRGTLRVTAAPVAILAAAGIAVVLAVGLLWVHGRIASGGQRDCPPSPSVSTVSSWTPGSAAGGQPSHGQSVVPKPTPTPVLVPTVSGGHVRVTFVDNRSTIVVPVGTVIDVELTTYQWSLPISSDPRMLPRLSSSSSCDGVRASFRAQGDGWIESYVHTPENVGAPDIVFRLNLHVTP